MEERQSRTSNDERLSIGLAQQITQMIPSQDLSLYLFAIHALVTPPPPSFESRGSEQSAIRMPRSNDWTDILGSNKLLYNIGASHVIENEQIFTMDKF